VVVLQSHSQHKKPRSDAGLLALRRFVNPDRDGCASEIDRDAELRGGDEATGRRDGPVLLSTLREKPNERFGTTKFSAE